MERALPGWQGEVAVCDGCDAVRDAFAGGAGNVGRGQSDKDDLQTTTLLKRSSLIAQSGAGYYGSVSVQACGGSGGDADSSKNVLLACWIQGSAEASHDTSIWCSRGETFGREVAWATAEEVVPNHGVPVQSILLLDNYDSLFVFGEDDEDGVVEEGEQEEEEGETTRGGGGEQQQHKVNNPHFERREGGGSSSCSLFFELGRSLHSCRPFIRTTNNGGIEWSVQTPVRKKTRSSYNNGMITSLTSVVVQTKQDQHQKNHVYGVGSEYVGGRWRCRLTQLVDASDDNDSEDGGESAVAKDVVVDVGSGGMKGCVLLLAEEDDIISSKDDDGNRINNNNNNNNNGGKERLVILGGTSTSYTARAEVPLTVFGSSSSSSGGVRSIGGRKGGKGHEENAAIVVSPIDIVETLPNTGSLFTVVDMMMASKKKKTKMFVSIYNHSFKKGVYGRGVLAVAVSETNGRTWRKIGNIEDSRNAVLEYSIGSKAAVVVVVSSESSEDNNKKDEEEESSVSESSFVVVCYNWRRRNIKCGIIDSVDLLSSSQ